jgi:hypothetical protein
MLKKEEDSNQGTKISFFLLKGLIVTLHSREEGKGKGKGRAEVWIGRSMWKGG